MPMTPDTVRSSASSSKTSRGAASPTSTGNTSTKRLGSRSWRSRDSNSKRSNNSRASTLSSAAARAMGLSEQQEVPQPQHPIATSPNNKHFAGRNHSTNNNMPGLVPTTPEGSNDSSPGLHASSPHSNTQPKQVLDGDALNEIKEFISSFLAGSEGVVQPHEIRQHLDTIQENTREGFPQAASPTTMKTGASSHTDHLKADMNQAKDLSTLVQVRIVGSKGNAEISFSFFVPVSLVLERELEMRQAARQFDISKERWNGSRLYREWKNIEDDLSSIPPPQHDTNTRVTIQSGKEFFVTLDPEKDCAATNHSQTLIWSNWLTTCVRAYYNTGTIRIADECLGSDILLALEYFGIVYTPEQLVFDSFGAYLRVKMWSDYFTHRARMADWIVQKLLRSHSRHSHAFCTSPEPDENQIIMFGTKRVEVFDGSLPVEASKAVASCAVVHDFFFDDATAEKEGGSLDVLMRTDFSNYVKNSLPGTEVSFDIKEVKVNGKTWEKRAVLQVVFARPSTRCDENNGWTLRQSIAEYRRTTPNDNGAFTTRRDEKQQNQRTRNVRGQNGRGNRGTAGMASSNRSGAQTPVSAAPSDEGRPTMEVPAPFDEPFRTIEERLSRNEEEKKEDYESVELLDSGSPIKAIVAIHRSDNTVISALTGPFEENDSLPFQTLYLAHNNTGRAAAEGGAVPRDQSIRGTPSFATPVEAFADQPRKIPEAAPRAPNGLLSRRVQQSPGTPGIQGVMTMDSRAAATQTATISSSTKMPVLTPIRNEQEKATEVSREFQMEKSPLAATTSMSSGPNSESVVVPLAVAYGATPDDGYRSSSTKVSKASKNSKNSKTSRSSNPTSVTEPIVVPTELGEGSRQKLVSLQQQPNSQAEDQVSCTLEMSESIVWIKEACLCMTGRKVQKEVGIVHNSSNASADSMLEQQNKRPPRSKLSTVERYLPEYDMPSTNEVEESIIRKRTNTMDEGDGEHGLDDANVKLEDLSSEWFRRQTAGAQAYFTDTMWQPRPSSSAAGMLALLGPGPLGSDDEWMEAIGSETSFDDYDSRHSGSSDSESESGFDDDEQDEEDDSPVIIPPQDAASTTSSKRNKKSKPGSKIVRTSKERTSKGTNASRRSMSLSSPPAMSTTGAPIPADISATPIIPVSTYNDAAAVASAMSCRRDTTIDTTRTFSSVTIPAANTSNDKSFARNATSSPPPVAMREDQTQPMRKAAGFRRHSASPSMTSKSSGSGLLKSKRRKDKKGNPDTKSSMSILSSGGGGGKPLPPRQPQQTPQQQLRRKMGFGSFSQIRGGGRKNNNNNNKRKKNKKRGGAFGKMAFSDNDLDDDDNEEEDARLLKPYSDDFYVSNGRNNKQPSIRFQRASLS